MPKNTCYAYVEVYIIFPFFSPKIPLLLTINQDPDKERKKKREEKAHSNFFLCHIFKNAQRAAKLRKHLLRLSLWRAQNRNCTPGSNPPDFSRLRRFLLLF